MTFLQNVSIQRADSVAFLFYVDRHILINKIPINDIVEWLHQDCSSKQRKLEIEFRSTESRINPSNHALNFLYSLYGLLFKVCFQSNNHSTHHIHLSDLSAWRTKILNVHMFSSSLQEFMSAIEKNGKRPKLGISLQQSKRRKGSNTQLNHIWEGIDTSLLNDLHYHNL